MTAPLSGVRVVLTADPRQEAIAAGRGPSLSLGVIAGIGFAAALPWLTRSSWSYVSGATDYIAITLAGIGAAIAVVYTLTPLIALARPRAQAARSNL